MREDFLHYIWQYQKMTAINLRTVAGDELQVIEVGQHNFNSGPDFYHSKLRINKQVWVGTVELHLKSSDWFAHQHQADVTYDNVILHVVWEDDVAVYDKHNNPLQTLVLKNYVDESLLLNYKQLLKTKNWINCENQLHKIDGFTMTFWKEKLLVKRLERKSVKLNNQLIKLENDWEGLLFVTLAENFGLKLNSDSFLQLAKNISFSKFKKQISNVFELEALLFGQANLLNTNCDDAYFKELITEYKYLKNKHQLEESFVIMQFFRMRPANFPTIRLSQFAMLYHKHQSLFSKVMAVDSITELRDLFAVSASNYWDTHYTFGKISFKRKKSISNNFIDLLVLNVVIPIKFLYAKTHSKTNLETLLQLYRAIKPEKNTVVMNFEKLTVSVNSAADSQALIELKTQFCATHKCLQCEIGNKLLYPS